MYLILRTQIEFKFKAALRWRWGLVRQIHYSHTWLMGKETLRHNEQWVAAGCSLWALSSRQPLTARHRTDCLRTAWRSRWKGQFVNYVTVYLKRYKCEGREVIGRSSLCLLLRWREHGSDPPQLQRMRRTGWHHSDITGHQTLHSRLFASRVLVLVTDWTPGSLPVH